MYGRIHSRVSSPIPADAPIPANAPIPADAPTRCLSRCLSRCLWASPIAWQGNMRWALSRKFALSGNRAGTGPAPTIGGPPLFGRICRCCRICNPTTANIGICDAVIPAQNRMIIRNHPMNSHGQASPCVGAGPVPARLPGRANSAGNIHCKLPLTGQSG